jgi:ParB family chromosome partitioning protein
MAARGKRTSLADLAGAVGENSPVEQAVVKTPAPRTVSLHELAPNPRNPRDDLGDLSDLEGIADLQLQAATVVTRAAYLALYPEDPVTARYVVINGCRRLAAAHKYGRSDLAIVVNDEIARDRVTLISAAIAENVDRKDFDVIEEAKAVASLVAECGRADLAAEKLHKTGAWVSQRRALLELAPELQTALRRGELAIREARALARVPQWEQVARWNAALDKASAKKESAQDEKSGHRPPSPTRAVTAALAKFDREPASLAGALREFLGDDGVNTLVGLLQEP